MANTLMARPVSASVEAYARRLAALTQDDLVRDFSERPEAGEPWYGYVEEARSLTLFLNLQLNRLTSEIRSTLAPDRAAELCAQHHRAYRDLTGALAGIEQIEFDRVPAEGEWPLRTVIWHITIAELGFSLLIDWAVRRADGEEDLPIQMPSADMEPHQEAYPETGTMDELLARYAQLHERIVGRLIALSGDQLNALNIWWEGYEVPVWFRMHRFDAHLREHTIQVDKTRQAIDRAPTEPERLARLLHQSLADLEVALARAGEGWDERVAALAGDFDAWRQTDPYDGS